MSNTRFKRLTEDQLPEHIKDHVAKFGKRPNVIGIFWSDPDQLG